MGAETVEEAEPGQGGAEEAVVPKKGGDGRYKIQREGSRCDE